MSWVALEIAGEGDWEFVVFQELAKKGQRTVDRLTLVKG